MFLSKALLLFILPTSCFSRLMGTTDEVENLICRITMVATKFDDDAPGEEMDYMCETVDEHNPSHRSGSIFALPLPDDFVAQHPTIEDGDTFISIPNGTVVVSQDPLVPPHVDYPSGAPISIVESSGHHRNLALSPHERAQGIKSVLVVRVTSLDSEVPLSAEELSGRVFGIGDDAPEVSVAGQFNDCSYGKLQMKPAEGPGIINGVAEVFVDRYTTVAADVSEYTPELEDRANSLTDQYDHVIYCLPERSIRNGRRFIAFARVSSAQSYYNGAWCGNLSAIMHELGHNLGLQHSGIAGQTEYADVSGYMGFAHSGTPAMCYNGYNHWYMGWYDDRRVEVNSNHAWKVHLDAFTDYDSPNAGDNSVVVMKVGDYYLQYNRAEKFNIGTRQFKDEITVVRLEQYGRTLLMGKISLGDSVDASPLFVIENFNGSGHTMIIEACSHEFSDPDRYTLSVHLDDGQQQSECSGGTIYLEPSSAPSGVPPSQAPSRSMMPSSSQSPSQSPSIFICDDDHIKLFGQVDGRYDGCDWLRNRSPDVIAANCVPGQPAYDLCEETCGRCQDGCHDSSEEVVINANGLKRSCEWISRYPAWIRRLCVPGQEAYTKCGETCNTCELQNKYIAPSVAPSTLPSISTMDTPTVAPLETCEDSWTETFFVDASPRWQADRTCVWLSRSVAWQRRRCVPEHPAYHACSELCGKCQDSCTDDETFTTFINDNHQFQGCHWMSIRPVMAGRLCGRSEVAEACRETCDTCSAGENKVLP